MKKLRLGLAALLALAAGVDAALIHTITVTTTADEDGSNPAACSLREAVKAVNTFAPYGGCPAGHPFNDNLVQLDSTTYTLTLGELVVSKEVAIVGKDEDAEARKNQVNPLTGRAPLRVRPDYDDTETTPIGDVADPDTGPVGTYINANDNSRIFFATAPLTVRDAVLNGSGPDSSGTSVNGNGGLIYSAGSLVLSNVILRNGWVTGNSSDAGNGGAIYLAGSGTGLTLSDVTLEANTAQRTGGAIAMLCSLDLDPYIGHGVTVERSLFKSNQALGGAGAVDICGRTNAIFTASTFSRNSSLVDAGRQDSAAISYVHPDGKNPQLGNLTLSNVTAAEQVGHVLALRGIASAVLGGSLLAFNTGDLGFVCFNPDVDDPDSAAVPATAAVPMVSVSPGGGTYNAVTAGGSCDALLARGAGDTNRDIPTTVLLVDVLTLLTEADPFTSGGPFGLTQYYLPNEAAPTWVIDQGGVFNYCGDADQRGINRRSGAACDIGAVERLQVSANADEGENTRLGGREVVIDVLANDTFGESPAEPFKFRENDPSTPADEGPVVITDDDGGRCKWELRDVGAGVTAGRLVVTSPQGMLRGEDDPIVCTYEVHDTGGGVSSPATVKATIGNIPPIARDDVYLRPMGVASITFNPLENDDDSGDGKYGYLPEPPVPPDVGIVGPGGVNCKEDPLLPGECSYSSEPNWVDLYPPIEITSQPELGEVRGVTVDQCPGRVTSICHWPPLTYRASNSLSPFSDSFTYRVYDNDEEGSSATFVTIKTNASDLDQGGGGGSLDILGGLILALLGLRRLRRL
ncbi:MAG: CSLREA domain-containing protein [Pseudomonadota bacterium]